MPKQSAARTHTRPAHSTEIVCLYPKYDQWLTLDQYQYLKSLNGVEPGTAALNDEAVREEVSASGLSEVPSLDSAIHDLPPAKLLKIRRRS